MTRFPIGFIFKHLLQTIPVLFGVTLVTFSLFHIIGGDPSFQLAGKNATLEQIESIRRELGLNKPLYLQYIDFLKQSLTFQWGHSWHTQQNIGSMVLEGLGPSLALCLPAFFISLFLALGVALFSAYSVKTKNFWDSAITSLCLASMSISFLVYVLVFQYIFAFYFNLFPVTGWDPHFPEMLHFLTLPWIIGALVFLGPNILLFRSSLLDQIHQDYVRTGKAKGLGTRPLFWTHILKNSLIPISTVVMLQIPFLMTGSLLLETFFGIPGLGGLLIQAIQNADFPVIKALTVMGSLLYIIFNALADISYALIDPRIRLQ